MAMIVMHEVCDTILEEMRSWFIQLRDLKKNHCWVCTHGLPKLCEGHLWDPHPILWSPHCALDDINCKGFFSAIFQGVVDHHGRVDRLALILGLGSGDWDAVGPQIACIISVEQVDDR